MTTDLKENRGFEMIHFVVTLVGQKKQKSGAKTKGSSKEPGIDSIVNELEAIVGLMSTSTVSFSKERLIQAVSALKRLRDSKSP